ncbi:MAG: hypothetical protein GX783_08320 [Clostridiales bacterium]|nr:hypothetical protein [Clostridiales bacterium]
MTSELSMYYYNMGLAHLNRNYVSIAIENLKKAVYWNPENHIAWNLLGLSYYRAGRIPMAKHCWLESAKNSKFVELFSDQQADLQLDGRYYLNLLEDSGNDAIGNLSKAIELAEQGEYKTALQQLDDKTNSTNSTSSASGTSSTSDTNSNNNTSSASDTNSNGNNNNNNNNSTSDINSISSINSTNSTNSTRSINSISSINSINSTSRDGVIKENILESPQLLSYAGILEYLSKNKKQAETYWLLASQLDKSDERPIRYLEYTKKSPSWFTRKLKTIRLLINKKFGGKAAK